jgi:hypothetical protein
MSFLVLCGDFRSSVVAATLRRDRIELSAKNQFITLWMSTRNPKNGHPAVSFVPLNDAESPKVIGETAALPWPNPMILLLKVTDLCEVNPPENKKRDSDGKFFVKREHRN